MRSSVLAATAAVLGLLCAPPLAAQQKEVVDGPNVRVKRHADGSKSVFERNKDNTVVVKRTENAAGRVTLVTKYTMFKDGNPNRCHIYDGQGTLLYEVDYAYRKSDGILAMERMRDRRVKRYWPDRPGEEMPVQVIHYVDANGKPIQPLVVKYLEGKSFEEVYGTASTHINSKEVFEEEKPAGGGSRPATPKPSKPAGGRP
jgi:hypothetical protein